MGNGYLSVIFRSANPHNVPAIPADYALTIGVSKSISLNYDHVNSLSPVIQNYITTNGAKWMCMQDGAVDTPDVSPRRAVTECGALGAPPYALFSVLPNSAGWKTYSR